MTNNFTTQPYRDPSRPSARQEERGQEDFQNENAQEGMLTGLREAQEELGGAEPEEENGVISDTPNVEDFSSRHSPEEANGDPMEIYSRKVREEKTKLENIQEYLVEAQGKISERLEKISRLEEALEKTTRNLETIRSEISSIDEFSSQVLGQIKKRFKE